MKISVITPVYNCEQFLERCINSVLKQTLGKDEVEIILIDDGSNDGSGLIMDRYVANNDNISVIHQANQGVSVARNNGIKAVTRDFIHFLDGDDFLMYDNAYQSLLNIIRQESQNVDVLTFSMTRVDKFSQQHLQQYYNLDSIKVLFRGPGRDVCKELRFEGYMCSSLYRTGLIKNHQHGINANVFLSEDTLFNLELYLEAQNVIQTNAMIYGYYANPDSATLTNDKDRLYKLIDNLFLSIDPTVEVLKQYDDKKFMNERMRNHGKAIAKRLMMLNAPYKSTRDYIKKGFEKGVFPFVCQPSGYYETFLNALLRHPWAFWLMSGLFRHVVHPYVKPLIPKN